MCLDLSASDWVMGSLCPPGALGDPSGAAVRIHGSLGRFVLRPDLQPFISLHITF